jgi:hypothetical protein
MTAVPAGKVKYTIGQTAQPQKRAAKPAAHG